MCVCVWGGGCLVLFFYFWFLNHLAEEERAGYFISIPMIVFLVRLKLSLTLPRALSWVSLQHVTVAFIGHTHLLCVLFCCVVICVLSRLAITSLWKREVDANYIF